MSDILYRFDNGNDFGVVFNPYEKPVMVFQPGLPPLEAKVVAFAANEDGPGPLATGTFKRWPEQYTLWHSLVVGEPSDVSVTRDIPTDDHPVATCSGLPPGLAVSGARIQGASSAIGVTEAKCTIGDSRGNSVTTTELFVVGKTVSDVTMDGLQKCAIATDGEARCWDFSENGEAVVPSGLKLKSIATGSEITCGIGLDDRVTCWGSYLSTKKVNVTHAKKIALGIGDGCAIDLEGKLQCWGFIADVAPTGSSAVDLQSSASPGLDYCILRPDSTVGCFSFADIDSVASAVPAGLRARAISVGREHACAITTDDDVVCWGSNSRRQSQVPSDLGKVRDVEASISTTCAITRSNEIRCWGNNESHSWGTAPADGVTRWVRSTIEAACGITDTGKLKCFNVRGISPYYSAWHDFPIWYGGFCGLEPRGGLCQLDWRPG